MIENTTAVVENSSIGRSYYEKWGGNIFDYDLGGSDMLNEETFSFI